MRSHTPSWEKYQCFLSDGTSGFVSIALGFIWGPVSLNLSLQQSQPSLVGTPRGLQPLTHLRNTRKSLGHRVGNKHHCALDFCQPSALSHGAKDGGEY